MTSAAKKVPELTRFAHQVTQAEAIEELRAHTQAYCEAVVEGLEDFFGVQAQLGELVEVQKGYCPAGDVHFSVPFSGLVNGEYIINVDESVAAELADCELPEDEADPVAREEQREEVGAAMCELLNTAVGSVIGELAGRYPHLSFASPRISYGQRIYPMIRFGHSDLSCEAGSLRCHFYLDHMELDLATSYAKVRASAQKAKAALESHLEMVERILDDIDIALFWVKPDGGFFPRYANASPEVLGVEASRFEGSFVDVAMAHLGGIGPNAAELQAWLDKAFAAADVQTWEQEVLGQCPLRVSKDREGKELHWRWLAVRPQDDETEGVSSLLVAVQDAQREAFENERASSDFVAQLALNEWSMYHQE